VTESLGIVVLSRGHSYRVAANISGRVVSLFAGQRMNDPPLLLGGFKEKHTVGFV